MKVVSSIYMKTDEEQSPTTVPVVDTGACYNIAVDSLRKCKATADEKIAEAFTGVYVPSQKEIKAAKRQARQQK